MGCVISRKIHPLSHSSTPCNNERIPCSSNVKEMVSVTQMRTRASRHARKHSYKIEFSATEHFDVESMHTSYIENLAKPKVSSYLI